MEILTIFLTHCDSRLLAMHTQYDTKNAREGNHHALFSSIYMTADGIELDAPKKKSRENTPNNSAMTKAKGRQHKNRIMGYLGSKKRRHPSHIHMTKNDSLHAPFAQPRGENIKVKKKTRHEDRDSSTFASTKMMVIASSTSSTRLDTVPHSHSPRPDTKPRAA